eukprot:scaffold16.g24.t1
MPSSSAGFTVFLGRNVTLEVEEHETVQDVKAKVEAKEGTPAPLQRLLYAGKQLEDGATLAQCGVGRGATLHLALRLRGGKGGFGSLLRGAGKHKLVDNYDACRDLQGRRIRHKTAEKTLLEWQASAPEREREKQLAREAREAERAAQRAQRAEVDVQAVRQEHNHALKDVLAAVQAAVKSAPGAEGGASAAGGRRRAAGQANGAKGKRRRLIDPLAALSDDEDMSDSEEEEEEAGAVPAAEAAKEAQPVAAQQQQQQQSKGAEPAATAELEVPAAAAKPAGEAAADTAALSDKSSDEHVTAGGSPAQATDAAPAAAAAAAAGPEAPAEPAEPATAAAAAAPAAPLEPVDLAEFGSAAELEAVGMGRLKAELQRRGLKCGGNLQQRAARLFLLKSTPLEQLDKKHLAK